MGMGFHSIPFPPLFLIQTGVQIFQRISVKKQFSVIQYALHHRQEKPKHSEEESMEQKSLSFHRRGILRFLIIIATFCHAKPRSHQVPRYMKFVYNATEIGHDEYYDYIIIGGGTAGCPLAATLSRHHKVLVLERGGVPFRNPNVMTQEGFLATITETDEYQSPSQTFVSEEGVTNARGRVLGGSSAINAGFYSRADQDFYAKSGVNWDMRVVNRSYQWVEKAVVFKPELRRWQNAVQGGLLEAGVNPYNGYTLDHLPGTKIGGTTFDSSGRRHSAADLLNYANPANIRVVIHADVERVLFAYVFKNSKVRLAAVGAAYRDSNRRRRHAMVHEHGEVIISAGAIGSPQLLLMSGIGSRSYLTSVGVRVLYHHPHVGRQLCDNPRNGISIVPSIPLEHSLIQVVGITESGTYIEAASNVIPFAARSVFIRSPSFPLYLTVATLMEKFSGPASAGSLSLASMDVRANPIIRFNYFSDPVDLERCVNGTRRIGEVLKTLPMQNFVFREWFGGGNFRFVGLPLPENQTDDLQMADFCRRSVSTIWHYHGGCVVGKVVDRNYRVTGVAGLRVVDGSTFTVSPGTNPQATVMMLGRYMGLKMIRERARHTY